MFALFSLSVLFTSLASLPAPEFVQKIADSQCSQLDEEDLNNLEEAVSENNACSSSTESGEIDERNSLLRSGYYAKLLIHKL